MKDTRPSQRSLRDRWLVSYADLVTILLVAVIVVVLLSAVD